MLVGKTTKTNLERRRVTITFEEWLDEGETIASITTPVVALQANAWPGPWPDSTPILATPVVPDDPTPMVVANSYIIASDTKVQLFFEDGTEGNSYAVTFVATGSSSTREVEIRVDVSVRAVYSGVTP